MASELGVDESVGVVPLVSEYARIDPHEDVDGMAEAAGALVVTDLGIPPFLVDEAQGSLHLLTGRELAACLVPRAAHAHKGDFGHTLIVAGAPGKAGAAILAARAAVRGGAGLVTAAVPQPVLAVVDGGSLESMTLGLPANPDGGLAAVADHPHCWAGKTVDGDPVHGHR